ncbi:O-antigen ligase family protein [Candidatus Wolfebacteria bacterium]|nr:O-antigen ligase family protein [Candidatus Wolfebacteria bacterium]
MKTNIVQHIVRQIPHSTLHTILFLAAFLLLFSWTDVAPADVVFITLGVATVAIIVYRRRIGELFRDGKAYAVLAFAAYVSLSFFLISEQSYVFGLTTLYGVGVYFLVRYWATTDAGASAWPIRGYLAAAILSSLLGAGAYAAHALSLVGRDTLFFWQGDVRVAVFFDDPVVYGAFLAPALLICLVYALSTTRSAVRGLSTVAFFLIYLNIILSGSRGAWLNVGIGLAVLAALAVFNKNPWRLFSLRRTVSVGISSAIIGLLVLFIIPLGSETYYEATLKDRLVTSDAPRFATWKAAPVFSSARPPAEKIFGSGSGTFERYSPDGISAHNTYLRVLFEQGVLGLVLFTLFLLAALYSLIRRIQREPWQIRQWFFLAALSGALVQAFFIDALHWRHLWILLGLL